jgi:hypothetical protein
MSNNQCHEILRLVVLGLCLLSATAAQDIRQSLTDYMRTTPAPTEPQPEERQLLEPSVAPSHKPTYAPSQSSSTLDSTTNALNDPTLATSANGKDDESSTSLYMTNMEHGVSYGEVFIQFSLFSPNVTNREMNFMKLKMGISNSINAIICDMSSPVAELGLDYCAVRADLLLKMGSHSREIPLDITSETAVLASSTTNVQDDSSVTQSQKVVSWTSWKLGWDVIQIGAALRSKVTDKFGANLSDEESLEKATMILQQIMSDEFDRILREGIFERGLNVYLEDFMVLTSAAGEEVATYSVFANSGASAQGQERVPEDAEGSSLMIIFFFGGLGAATLLVVVLLCFSVRYRRKPVPPPAKRTIIIVDDTSKTESDRSSTDKVMVFDTDEALKDDPPRGQQDIETNGEAEGDGEVGGDAEATEDQTTEARSTTYSVAHTGSISAITGVSGLENSDTWSVGSMSMDLAEWS